MDVYSRNRCQINCLTTNGVKIVWELFVVSLFFLLLPWISRSFINAFIPLAERLSIMFCNGYGNSAWGIPNSDLLRYQYFDISPIDWILLPPLDQIHEYPMLYPFPYSFWLKEHVGLSRIQYWWLSEIKAQLTRSTIDSFQAISKLMSQSREK